MKTFLPYGTQWIDQEDTSAVIKALQSNIISQGPHLEEFEAALAKKVQAKYCVAVANGTAALHLAVAALKLEKNAEGITSPITYTATPHSLVYNGLTPVFADIQDKTYNIDLKKLTEKITDNTRLLLLVHFAGHPVDMEEIRDVAKEKNLRVIEDAAHALGSKYPNGKMVGSCIYSDLTIFSFHPVKMITTGEGGAITTNDPKLYSLLKSLRMHGITRDSPPKTNLPWYYKVEDLGFNYKLTEFQAALGTSQLKKLDFFVKRRREIVELYNENFLGIPNIQIPTEKPGYFSSYHLYVLLINFDKIGMPREKFMAKLKEFNVGSQVHYIPIHLHPFYQKNYSFKKGDFPVAEKYYDKALSIPLYPKMTNQEAKYVIESIKKCLSGP